MTDRTARVEFAIATYQKALRLGDWEIRYSDDQNDIDKDTLAQTDQSWAEHIATIRIAQSVEGDQIEHSVCHELVHLVLLDYSNLCANVLSKHGDSALGVIDHLAEVQERICSQVATALTGVIYEPCGPDATRIHKPFVNHSVSKETQ